MEVNSVIQGNFISLSIYLPVYYIHLACCRCDCDDDDDDDDRNRDDANVEDGQAC